MNLQKVKQDLQQRLASIISGTPSPVRAAEARKIIIAIHMIDSGDVQGSTDLLKIMPYVSVNDKGELVAKSNAPQTLDGLDGKFIDFFKKVGGKVKNVVSAVRGEQPASQTATGTKKKRPLINKIKNLVKGGTGKSSFVDKAKNFFAQVQPTIKVDTVDAIKQNWGKLAIAAVGTVALAVGGFKLANRKKN